MNKEWDPAIKPQDMASVTYPFQQYHVLMSPRSSKAGILNTGAWEGHFLFKPQQSQVLLMMLESFLDKYSNPSIFPPFTLAPKQETK